MSRKSNRTTLTKNLTNTKKHKTIETIRTGREETVKGRSVNVTAHVDAITILFKPFRFFNLKLETPTLYKNPITSGSAMTNIAYTLCTNARMRALE
jgi:hypothetical protein